MSVTLSPLPIQRFVDNAGNALVGGKLFTYLAGTVTKALTYTDVTGATDQTNPIILNARGEPENSGGASIGIWLDVNVAYKMVLAPSTDTDPPTNPIWTLDGVQQTAGAPDVIPSAIVINLNELAAQMGTSISPINTATANLIDVTAVLAAALAAQADPSNASFGLPIWWTGCLYTTSTVFAAALPSYAQGDNAYIGSAIKITAPGRDVAWWQYGGTGFALDDAQIAANLPGVRSGCRLSGFRIFGTQGPGYGAAAGLIRICNWRLGEVTDIMFDSCRNGSFLTCYGMINGDFQYVQVHGCQFGWWSLNRNAAYAGIPARIGLDDFWWGHIGIDSQGAEDAQGKCNENRYYDNDFYNCDISLSISGYPSTAVPPGGNPGIPNPTQQGILGGGAYNASHDNSFQSTQSKNLWVGAAGSGSTSSTLVLGVATSVYTIGFETNGYFVSPGGVPVSTYASVVSGVCAGQYAQIVGYTYAAGVGTISIMGQWAIGVPASGDSIIIGYRSIGILINSDGGFSSISDKTEQVTDPIVITATTNALPDRPSAGSITGNIKIEPLVLINSGGNGVVLASSQGPWTVQSVSGMVLTMPNTMSPLGNWYCRQWRSTALIVSGTGSAADLSTRTGQTVYNGITFQVEAWSGAPSFQLTAAAQSWLYTAWVNSTTPCGVTPDNTSVIQFLPGAQPLFVSPSPRLGGIDYDSTQLMSGTNQILDDLTIVSRYQTPINGSGYPVGTPDVTQNQTFQFFGLNSTGATITAGDVVRIQTSGNSVYLNTSGTGDPGCVVVAGLSGTETYPNGEFFPYAGVGSQTQITMLDGTAVGGNSVVGHVGNVGNVATAPTPEAFIGTIIGKAFLATSGKYTAKIKIR